MSLFTSDAISRVFSKLNQFFGNKLHMNNPYASSPLKPTQKPLNILALNWRCLLHPQAGGAEENLFQQAQYWRSSGHTVTVFTANPGDEYLNNNHKLLDSINLLRYGNRFTIYIYALIYILFNSHKYDVIFDVSNGIPFFAPLVTFKPVTLMVHHVHHDQWFEEFSPKVAQVGWFLESKLVPWIYRNKQVITVSPTTEQELLKIGFKLANLTIAYNGLNTKTPAFVGSRRSPRIAYIGRVKAYKRLALLLRAVAKLSATFPDIHLDVAGGGDDIGNLQSLISELGIKSYVTIHGYVSEQKKAKILSNARVFVTPSMQEGWGISVLEANAYGCPAVAYNVPGLSASIPNNETGLLAENDDEFIHCIAKILSDDELAERLSNGAVYWASLFRWESTAETTLSIFKKVA